MLFASRSLAKRGERDILTIKKARSSLPLPLLFFLVSAPAHHPVSQPLRLASRPLLVGLLF